MEAQKVVIKFPVKTGNVDLGAVGAAFTKWIQENSLPGTMIDVADYSHMHEGLGVILVAHEYIVSLDQQDGIDGLKVVYRLNSEDSLSSRIKAGFDLLSQADALLKKDGVELNLDTSEFFVGVADRLNTSEAIHDQILTASKQALSDSAECLEKSEVKEIPGIKVKIA